MSAFTAKRSLVQTKLVRSAYGVLALGQVANLLHAGVLAAYYQESCLLRSWADSLGYRRVCQSELFRLSLSIYTVLLVSASRMVVPKNADQ